ncbi:MAG: M20 family metallopeptidase [Chloroflexi bacterium]|nr:M20 family metallopeptidase [Chloroflexota bacterium]
MATTRTITEALKAQAVETIERSRAQLIEISDLMHANPEIGFEEVKASGWLAEALGKAGYQVERDIAGMPTAFRATWENGSGGPCVAIMAEYDALPNVGHACGHNLIGTAALGAAIALKETLGDIPGKVMVVGSPAEEIIGRGGKVPLVEQGYYGGADVAMMCHPSSRTAPDNMLPSLAAVQLILKFHGKSAHASSFNWAGINALDALLLTFNNINALRQHVREDARIHGIVRSGGKAPNVVPDYSEGDFYVRAADRPYLEELTERVKNCARAGALATGCTIDIEESFVYAERRINQTLARASMDNLLSLGLTEDAPREGRGSTDAGNVSQVIPLIHTYVQITPDAPPNHNPGFAVLTGSEPGHRCLMNMAKALAMTAIDVFTRPDFLAEVKAEFAKK